MSDSVNHPKHYVSLGAYCSACHCIIECIDIVRHQSFNLGCAMKYIWRADHKGKPLEDLRKAIFYLEDEIKRRSNINHLEIKNDH